ncbi:TAFII55 protein conserved region-domain-containing protein [Phycomyces nitens]|nr:TAFII55 protein conserved region-domain-containing protein [Phycomyces nitens]
MELKKETKVKIKRVKSSSSKSDALQDKLIKIKLTTKETAHSGSDDEDEPEAAIEEHLILRLPAGNMSDRLHEYVRKREIPDDVRLHFKDNRRGYFYLDGRKYDTTLVDLPTIIESQKTLDKKQFYKIADISQMLVVDGPSKEDAFMPPNNGRHSTDPYSYPHGLAPPLKHVRKRRFRKKLSKRAIEEVEREVERLLEVDATAEDVQYEVVDNREMEMELESDVGTQDIDIDMSDAESESDEDLAAAIDRGLEELEEEDNDDDDDDDDDNDDEDEDDSDEDEDEGGKTGEIEQKRQEIAEIKQAIQRKMRDLLTAPNAMLKKRFETSIESLKKELALKEAHLAEMSKYSVPHNDSST